MICVKSAAVVFVSNDGRVGLGLRSNRVSQPLTWAAIGGFQDEGESAVQTAYREVFEELGMRVPTRLQYLGRVGPNELFVCRVPEPFQPVRLNWENLDFQWKTLPEWYGYRLHPELTQVLRGRDFLAEEYNPDYTLKGFNPFSPKEAAYEEMKWGDSMNPSPKAKDYQDYYPDYNPKTGTFRTLPGMNIINWGVISSSDLRHLLGLPSVAVKGFGNMTSKKDRDYYNPDWAAAFPSVK